MSRSSDRRLVSLFTGAGGLDLGLEAAGFGRPCAWRLIADARKTLSENRPRLATRRRTRYSLALNLQDLLKHASIGSARSRALDRRAAMPTVLEVVLLDTMAMPLG